MTTPGDIQGQRERRDHKVPCKVGGYRIRNGWPVINCWSYEWQPICEFHADQMRTVPVPEESEALPE